MELKIEYLETGSLKAYEHNAKEHPKEQIKQIIDSIKQFGMNDPIAVWKDNIVIEGHGRLLAAQKMKLKRVPVIRLDNLTDEQRRAYALVHNKITMNSDFDVDILNKELDKISAFKMEDFGFKFLDDADGVDTELDRMDVYSKNVKIPQYEPTGAEVDISDLVDTGKTQTLVDEINNADIPDDVKEFLVEAAHRHSVFNYRNIAEYYANAPKEVQRLMEKSALVIIDVQDAIANGYVKLTKTIEDMIADEYE